MGDDKAVGRNSMRHSRPSWRKERPVHGSRIGLPHAAAVVALLALLLAQFLPPAVDPPTSAASGIVGLVQVARVPADLGTFDPDAIVRARRPLLISGLPI